MLTRTDDIRIDDIRPLLPPAILMEEIPVDQRQGTQLARARSAIGSILEGRDDRLLAVVGPCSVHDPVAGLDYARRLSQAAAQHARDLLIVMRTYFEKPRTTVGWKGLISDPYLDGSFAINQGLRVARTFLRDVLGLGLPTGTEFLDPITPQFIADLVAWGAIGARTSESQVHRELASGLSMPVGFKNGTDGTIQAAVDALRSAAQPHRFLSVTKQGVAAIVATKGNPQTHLILRGGRSGPNYAAPHLTAAASSLAQAGLRPVLMVDCSHANSGKDADKQAAVAEDMAHQIASGDQTVCGVMLESFLVAGRQEPGSRRSLVYGQSVTDSCMDWPTTESLLAKFAGAARTRRALARRQPAAATQMG